MEKIVKIKQLECTDKMQSWWFQAGDENYWYITHDHQYAPMTRIVLREKYLTRRIGAIKKFLPLDITNPEKGIRDFYKLLML